MFARRLVAAQNLVGGIVAKGVAVVQETPVAAAPDTPESPTGRQLVGQVVCHQCIAVARYRIPGVGCGKMR